MKVHCKSPPPPNSTGEDACEDEDEDGALETPSVIGSHNNSSLENGVNCEDLIKSGHSTPTIDRKTPAIHSIHEHVNNNNNNNNSNNNRISSSGFNSRPSLMNLDAIAASRYPYMDSQFGGHSLGVPPRGFGEQLHSTNNFRYSTNLSEWYVCQGASGGGNPVNALGTEQSHHHMMSGLQQPVMAQY